MSLSKWKLLHKPPVTILKWPNKHLGAIQGLVEYVYKNKPTTNQTNKQANKDMHTHTLTENMNLKERLNLMAENAVVVAAAGIIMQSAGGGFRGFATDEGRF